VSHGITVNGVLLWTSHARRSRARQFELLVICATSVKPDIDRNSTVTHYDSSPKMSCSSALLTDSRARRAIFKRAFSSGTSKPAAAAAPDTFVLAAIDASRESTVMYWRMKTSRPSRNGILSADDPSLQREQTAQRQRTASSVRRENRGCHH